MSHIYIYNSYSKLLIFEYESEIVPVAGDIVILQTIHRDNRFEPKKFIVEDRDLVFRQYVVPEQVAAVSLWAIHLYCRPLK